jgi:hypothetical protein
MLNDICLDTLNSQADLDFFSSYNNVYRDFAVNDDPYFGITISSNFHDIQSLSNMCRNERSGIFLSINIQSLISKHAQLVSEIAEMENKNLHIDVIAIQETWDVRYPEMLSLPGFNNLLFKKRRNMRGGGVGFYVRNGLNAEILEQLSPFENKIIEALTIQLTYPDNKSVLLTSIYRSNGQIPNVTPSQQLDRYMEKFSLLLSNLSATNRTSYVFLDANINLLNLHLPDVSNYMNAILDNSFLQIISKATRIHNDSSTLIDHVLSNERSLHFCSGTLVTDISDHFFTFILPNSISPIKQNHRTIISRDFSEQRLLEFKEELGRTDWNVVYSKLDVNEAYEEFWKVYNMLYNRIFRLKRTRFNKNIHKKQNFMTRGLLISRNTRKTLHKSSVAFPTAENVQKYKNYKTIYQRVLRGAKKLYFTSKLEENAKNPKKTWETLNEILGKNKNGESVEKINIEGNLVSDPPPQLPTSSTGSLLQLGNKFRKVSYQSRGNLRNILNMDVKYLILICKTLLQNIFKKS